MSGDELVKWILGVMTTGLFVMVGILDKRRTARIDQIERVQIAQQVELTKLQTLGKSVDAVRAELRDTHNETNHELAQIRLAMDTNFTKSNESIEKIYEIMIRQNQSNDSRPN